MTTQNLPDEILLRFKDGKLAGAHYVELTRYIDDSGEVITEKPGQARPIPTELSASILGSVNAAALARIAELEAEIAALQSSATEPAPTDSIKAWQAKAVLSLMGLLTAAETAIESLDEPQRTIIKSAWDNNADFPRQSPTILSLAVALSLSEEQVNDMFEQAASLSV
jgi:hypothetical protein